MKILFISNLFPDAATPNRGSDNAVVLRYLSRSAEIRVLSPRPVLLWKMLGTAKFKACTEDACFKPIYRRVPYIPKFGSQFNHRLMAAGIRKSVQEIRRAFNFDTVLVSWVYPDACATALLAQEGGFPFVAIAQGSDIHQYLKIPARRNIIVSSMLHSSGIIARSGELARLMNEAGIEAEKLAVVYNGIDFALFKSGDRISVRKQLGLPEHGKIILFVGNFLPIKNPLLLVRAHAELCRRAGGAPPTLVLVGSGPLEQQIRAEAVALGTADRVVLPGRKPPIEVARYMQASDLLCLSSHNEGLPNVVLEAFACGLRVVSTRVGGIHEVLCHEWLGGFAEKSEVSEMVRIIEQKLAEETDRVRIVQYASQFSWDSAADAYMRMLRKAVSGRVGRPMFK